MIENSTTGLTRLAPRHDVVMTGGELHQTAPAAYPPRSDGQPRNTVDLPTGAGAPTPPVPAGTSGTAARRRAAKPYLISTGALVGLLVITGCGQAENVPATAGTTTVAAPPSSAAAAPTTTTAPLAVPEPPPVVQPASGQQQVAQAPAAQPPAVQRLVAQPPAAQPPVAQPPVAKAPPPAPASGCDPNYSGCVPIASDVDCAGGGGNGPAYVQGPVRVIGSDIYKLDADKDGIGCE